LSVDHSALNVGSSASRGAVFLSYAREDTDAARRIADGLRSQGVEVWFDQNELRGGESWDAKIRKQIRECTLFMPVVSARTQERREGYFRREWKLAVERTNDMAGGVAFLVPVVIDETPEGEALVPDEFMRVQWTRLAGALPTTEFIAQVKQLLAGHRKPTLKAGLPRPPPLPPEFRQAARGQKSEAGGQRNDGRKSGPPAALWISLGVVFACVGVVFFVLRSKPPEPLGAERSALSVERSAKAAREPARDKSVAVLPFTNMSEEKDSAFFTDGMHEDILTNLALVRALRVVSRTSVMQYRGTTKPIGQIASELGVTYILEGSVRRSGNKVRVTGQLIHAATDEHVWAKSYDRDLTDIFSIQSELSQAIAAALSAALSPQEKQLLDRRPTENLAAYDLFVKARELRLTGSGTPMEIPPLLEEVVRLDPKFAQAWAELGSAHAQAYFNDFDHSGGRLASAKAAIDTAVRLAPNDPLVIEKLGDYYYYGYRDFTRATEQYQRLAVLRPNDAAVFGSLGFIHRRQGRWNEALTELRRAAELEPRNLRYVRTLAQLTAGLNRFDEAEAVQRQIVALFPDSVVDVMSLAVLPFVARGSLEDGKAAMARLPSIVKSEDELINWRKAWARGTGDWAEAVRLDRAHRYVEIFSEPRWSQDVSSAGVLWVHGDQPAARALAQEALSGGKKELEQKPSPTSWVQLSFAYAILGNKAEALRCAQMAKDLIPESKDAVAGPPLSVNYAQILAWVGEKDKALAELARLLRTPFGENIHAAKIGGFWFPLKDDPRFLALVNDPQNNAPHF